MASPPANGLPTLVTTSVPPRLTQVKPATVSLATVTPLLTRTTLVLPGWNVSVPFMVRV